MPVKRTKYQPLNTKEFFNNSKTIDNDKIRLSLKLFKAVERGDDREVDQLCEEGVMVNYIDSATNLSPLHIAVKNSNLYMVKKLLDYNSIINFHKFSLSGNKRIYPQEVLAANEDIIAKCSLQLSPLSLAVKNNDFDIAKLLISKNADVNFKNQEGKTLLHMAISNNHSDLVELLCRAGADVNQSDNKGHSPLELAIRKNNLEILETLIEHKANIGQVIKLGDHTYAPLTFAIKFNCNEDIIKLLLINNADPKEAMYYARTIGNIKLLKLLTENCEESIVPAQIKEYLKKENQLLLSEKLYDAAKAGKVVEIKDLCQQGASVNYVSNEWLTPLHIATMHNRLEAVKTLIELGAIIEPANADKKDFIAKYENSISICISEPSALFQACHNGHLKIAEELCMAKANINYIDKNGYNLLHIAALNGQAVMVKFLIDSGVDKDAKTIDGLTPRQIANENGYVDFLKEIDKYGLQSSKKINEDTTPLTTIPSNISVVDNEFEPRKVGSQVIEKSSSLTENFYRQILAEDEKRCKISLRESADKSKLKESLHTSDHKAIVNEGQTTTMRDDPLTKLIEKTHNELDSLLEQSVEKLATLNKRHSSNISHNIVKQTAEEIDLGTVDNFNLENGWELMG